MHHKALPRMDNMMYECSTCELLAIASFKHHDDKGRGTLKYYADLKGSKCSDYYGCITLPVISSWLTSCRVVPGHDL